jgi:polyhydroxyalkanoate synthesis repressor PhaR
MGDGVVNRRLDIRKYPNRRYYDATRSRHVKLEEIHDLIRQGYEIQVTDSKTGQDITQKVLAQIILELDPPKLDIFPVPLLHRLIRANEQLLQDFTEKYFNQALACFLESQKHFESYLRQAVGLQPAIPDWARMMFNPFMNPLWSPFMPHGNGRGTGAPDAAADLRARIGELQQQILSLQARLAEQEPDAAPPTL